MDTNPIAAAFGMTEATPPPSDAAAAIVAENSQPSPFEILAEKFKDIGADADANPGQPETPVDTPAGADKFPDAEALGESLKTPEAKAKWNELRNEHKTFETKVKEYEAKVAEYEAKLAEASKLAVSTELESKVKTYEEKLKTYEQELAISRVEATTEYKQLVSEPAEALSAAASALASRYQIDEQKVLDALVEGDAKRQNALLDEIVDGMSERDRSRLYRLVDDMSAVVEQDKALRERASTAWEEAQARAQAETEAGERQRKLSLTTATEKIISLFETKKLDAYGVDLAAVKAASLESDIDRASPEVKAYAAAAGNMLPNVLKALASKEARIRELEASVAKFTRATPGASATETVNAALGANPVSNFLFGG